MHANNEVGSISPINQLAAVAHESGALIHTDAVQSLGKHPLNVRDLDVDMMTLSAHKIYGPKGIGALYIRKGTPIGPLFLGGGQERGIRPGTENVALAVGFARAVELAIAEMSVEVPRLKRLRDEFEAHVRTRFPALVVNGHPESQLPHILSVSFDSHRIDLEGEMLIVNMDLRGIAVSSGSACTSGSVQPSHVLLAMGRDERTAKATIRFSLGKSSTREDLQYAADALEEVIRQMTARG
jgi:cysteine desulfurase